MQVMEERRVYRHRTNSEWVRDCEWESVPTLPKILSQVREVKERMKLRDRMALPAAVPLGFARADTPFFLLNGERVFLTRTALQSFQSKILPARFWTGFCDLVKINQPLAVQVWAAFAEKYGKGLFFGTMEREAKGKRFTILRSVLSDQYSVLADVDLMQSCIGTHLAHLPLLSTEVTDDYFNAVFLARSTQEQIATAFGEQSELIPSVRIWNSETGCASVGLEVGLYSLKHRVNVPMGDGRNRKTKVAWMHRGRRNLSEEVGKVLDDVIIQAQDLCRVLELVADESPEERVEAIEKALDGSVPKALVEEVMKRITGEKATDYGTLVDYLLFAAGSTDKIHNQRAIEAATGRILSGLVKSCQ